MAREVTFTPMDKMLVGFDKAANAVMGTLGPKGSNVFIDDPMAPKITNDGARIAREIDLPDKIENMGNKVVKNTSGQTNDDAGDGTTTTTTLLHALVHGALKRPENKVEIGESLKAALPNVLKELKKRSKKIDKNDIERVALISAQNAELASLVSEIIKKLGPDALITVEDSYDGRMTYEVVEGYDANVGYMAPIFINDQRHARAVYNDVLVFVSEKKIATIQDIKPLFDQLDKAKVSQLVIVCEDIDDSILGVLAANKVRGLFQSLVIRATGPLLQDIEAAVGAQRVSTQTGLNFDMVDVKLHLGRAKKVVCDQNKTLFVANGARAKEFSNHLQRMADNEHNSYIKQSLEKRIAKLRGGVAVLKIGAATDFDREYLKDKAEDTIKASQAALQEGIVEGGGVCFYRMAENMRPKTVGEELLRDALTTPFYTIIKNAGQDKTMVVVNMPKDKGYDAKNGTYVDMYTAGIVDPTKVERCSLENAVSAAATFITAFATITDYEEPKGK